MKMEMEGMKKIDYGKLSLKERMNLSSEERREMNRVYLEELKGKIERKEVKYGW